MDVREAITLIGFPAMCRESGVARVTVDVAKKNNKFQETSAGQKMRNVCLAHGLDLVGNRHPVAGPVDGGLLSAKPTF